MQDIKAKLAELKAKQIAKPVVPKPIKAGGKVAIRTAPMEQPKKVERVEEKSIAKNMDSIMVRVGSMSDKVAAHLEKQEAKGLYSIAGGADELEGFDADQFLRQLQDLDAATVEKSPDIRQFSRLIRKNLEQYPELTHILTDEQLGIITSGILTLAGVETEPKTKAAKTKRAKVKIEDLGNKDINDLFGGM